MMAQKPITAMQITAVILTPAESISDMTMVFLPPLLGMKNRISLYAYAIGTGVCMLGSSVRASRRPTYECPRASPTSTTPSSYQKFGMKIGGEHVRPPVINAHMVGGLLL